MQLEVTDGWYSVSASIDGPLRHYLASGVAAHRSAMPIRSLQAIRDSNLQVKDHRDVNVQ